MFKVQREQLVPGSGERRCSVCQHVFNAFEHQSEIDDIARQQTQQEITQPELFGPESTEPEPTEPEAAISQTISVIIAAEIPAPVFTPPQPIPDSLFQRRRFIWPAALKTLTAALVLLATAVVQSAFHFRAQVIEKQPRSYPLFAGVCQVFGCSVVLPHQAALVDIEDHRLLSDPTHDDVLILDSTLNNRAEFPQVYPLVELTLTDVNNQAVATRTFTPTEYLPNNFNIAAGLASHGATPIHLIMGVAGIKSSGYLLITKDEIVTPVANDASAKADSE
jgi:hypothetical protein